MRLLIFILVLTSAALSQIPPIEPGVSQELAKWRAAHYSDVRYRLNLTLEKMSPVLKGTIEIRVRVSGGEGEKGSAGAQAETRAVASVPPIILDWRKIKGHEEKSTISNITCNGKPITTTPSAPFNAGAATPPKQGGELNEHLIFHGGVVAGENVIKLDFTSPILTSGSAITRYVDKEDGSEYIYSLFVPSDASTAFPVFDQPDLKAKFKLSIYKPESWQAEIVSNGRHYATVQHKIGWQSYLFEETKPISTYVFAFAAGPFERVSETGGNPSGSEGVNTPTPKNTLPTGRVSASAAELPGDIYVRKSQTSKFEPHAAEVFRLNREAIKYFEQYFDYKFPFPKYDLVLIPEFPFGGMEHAGATFLRESAIIFPQEPTKNDLVSRATLIFHEAAHQWFGDTVTMRWFDDLWLKEGFATFTAYKAMEKIMPEMNAWKVFYERIKQGAYQTDSTKGTTPIYQEIKNLSAAKSAYGNIVYNKAPAFLRQAEFYLGEDKFQTAVRAFLKKHEFGNAGWEDLMKEFEVTSNQDLQEWAKQWVTQPGLLIFRTEVAARKRYEYEVNIKPTAPLNSGAVWKMKWYGLMSGTFHSFGPTLLTADTKDGKQPPIRVSENIGETGKLQLFVPNEGDYGYGIFLLDDKSRDYVLKNIQNEKDPFLRTMMWGSLWDSVREGELDPAEYVRLVVTILGGPAFRRPPTDDESTVALLLSRLGTAMNYYLPQTASATDSDRPPDRTVVNGRRVFTVVGSNDLSGSIETMLGNRMELSETVGQRITYYRAFLNIASSEDARFTLKNMLKAGANNNARIPLKTKDKFDIVTRLLVLNDPEAPKLLADLEKTEKSDDANRYAYAARAGIPTAENKAKYWNDFTNNKEISESWIEAAFGPWNSIRHSELTLPYLQKALQELPNHKRNRKIFFVNGWLGAFIGGQRSEEALNIVNKFLADNPNLDKDLRLKILENVDLIERAVKIRTRRIISHR